MRALVALVGLATLSLGATCAAQTNTAHEVRVSIPMVLRLSIENGASAPRAEVPLSIDVADGIVRIEPDHTRVQILANTRWQLTATFTPAEGSEYLVLGYKADGGAATWHRSSFAAVVLQGGATGGWRERVVRYALASLPADGRYGGVITYTLSRP